MRQCAAYCHAQNYQECIDLIAAARPNRRGDAMAHFFLAYAYAQIGHSQHAIHHYTQALHFDPTLAEAWFNRGNTFYASAKYAEAVNDYKNAIKHNPRSIEAYCNLSETLLDLNRPHSAIKTIKQAVRLSPRHPRVYLTYSAILSKLDRQEEAVAPLRKALQVQPGFTDAYSELGRVFFEMGKFKQATTALRQAIRINPLNFQAYFYLANMAAKSMDDELLKRLQFLFHRKPLPPRDKILLAFTLGRLYNARAQYDKAFPHWHMGNQLQRQEIHFSLQTARNFFHDVMNECTKDLLSQHFGGGFPSPRPIFIVGMPRSGTTLVEQILSNHSHVHGGGENPILANILNTIPKRYGTRMIYPQCIKDLPSRALYELGETYCRHIAKLSAANRVTCKTPQYFMHLGLVSLILPHAKIIHCRRHPLDVCLSCYSLLFRDSSMNFSYDLQDLVGYYRLYQQMMKHWRQVLPIPILDIAYEDLVSHPEPLTRALLDFCELPWEDECLQFHTSERAVKTASLAQVRQPMYHSSIHRWKHFEQYLKPLFPHLMHETDD
ncbi:tetratricopeptide repeat protein [bacterium]|nr:tetratricopeptide repeat protein [bacterium]